MAGRKRKHEPTAKRTAKDLESEARAALDQLLEPIVRKLKRRCKPFRKDLRFNQPVNVFTRWYRGSLYVVKVMQSPFERTLPFDSHVAKIEPSGKSRFFFSVPMRRGWIASSESMTAEECAERLAVMEL